MWKVTVIACCGELKIGPDIRYSFASKEQLSSRIAVGEPTAVQGA